MTKEHDAAERTRLSKRRSFSPLAAGAVSRRPALLPFLLIYRFFADFYALAIELAALGLARPHRRRAQPDRHRADGQSRPHRDLLRIRELHRQDRSGRSSRLARGPHRKSISARSSRSCWARSPSSPRSMRWPGISTSKSIPTRPSSAGSIAFPLMFVAAMLMLAIADRLARTKASQAARRSAPGADFAAITCRKRDRYPLGLRCRQFAGAAGR